jgi:hypothetical protein
MNAVSFGPFRLYPAQRLLKKGAPLFRTNAPRRMSNHRPIHRSIIFSQRFAHMRGRDDPVRNISEKLVTERFVTIVGHGGIGKTAAAWALRRADAEIILIDRHDHRIFQPLLYQVKIAVLAPAEAVRQIPLADNALRTSLSACRRIGRASHIGSGACVIPQRRRINHGSQCLEHAIAAGQEGIDRRLQRCACGRRPRWRWRRAEPVIDNNI